MNKMSKKTGKIWEKIRRRKLAVAISLVGIIVLSAAYAFVQTRLTFAVLTTPPPGIAGPYYVTAEAKIYGPVVDLAAIKSKMSGTYAPDYTYVQWGTNPFYRIYVDNTFQEVYYGQMIDILEQFSGVSSYSTGFPVENNFRSTYDSLKNVGGIDPTSVLGELHYFGNIPGSFIAYHTYHPSIAEITDYINVSSSEWYATEGTQINSYLRVYLNDTLCLNDPSDAIPSINSSGSSADFYRWKIVSGAYYHIFVTLYFKDLSDVQKTLSSSSELRIYIVVDSPGTGFVSKYVSPSSPVIGSTITVTVRLDPPSASKMNITDKYPNTFTWTGGQVTLQKYRIGSGSVATASVSVTPTPDGSNMKFTVYYNQAADVLQSLLSDEYVYMSYTLTAPSTMGEYTLPAATMTYLIPTP
jgi:hypothetical protein